MLLIGKPVNHLFLWAIYTMAMLNNQGVDKNATNLAQYIIWGGFFFSGGTFQTKLAMNPDQDGREHTKENEDVTFFFWV